MANTEQQELTDIFSSILFQNIKKEYPQNTKYQLFDVMRDVDVFNLNENITKLRDAIYQDLERLFQYQYREDFNEQEKNQYIEQIKEISIHAFWRLGDVQLMSPAMDQFYKIHKKDFVFLNKQQSPNYQKNQQNSILIYNLLDTLIIKDESKLKISIDGFFFLLLGIYGYPSFDLVLKGYNNNPNIEFSTIYFEGLQFKPEYTNMISDIPRQILQLMHDFYHSSTKQTIIQRDEWQTYISELINETISKLSLITNTIKQPQINFYKIIENPYDIVQQISTFSNFSNQYDVNIQMIAEIFKIVLRDLIDNEFKIQNLKTLTSDSIIKRLHFTKPVFDFVVQQSKKQPTKQQKQKFNGKRINFAQLIKQKDGLSKLAFQGRRTQGIANVCWFVSMLQQFLHSEIIYQMFYQIATNPDLQTKPNLTEDDLRDLQFIINFSSYFIQLNQENIFLDDKQTAQTLKNMYDIFIQSYKDSKQFDIQKYNQLDSVNIFRHILKLFYLFDDQYIANFAQLYIKRNECPRCGIVTSKQDIEETKISRNAFQPVLELESQQFQVSRILDKYTEQIEQYNCQKCGGKVTITQHIEMFGNKILVIESLLLRESQYKLQKSKTITEFPLEIQFNNQHKKERNQQKTYKLNSILLHRGQGLHDIKNTSGHYISIVRINNEYYILNDSGDSKLCKVIEKQNKKYIQIPKQDDDEQAKSQYRYHPVLFIYIDSEFDDPSKIDINVDKPLQSQLIKNPQNNNKLFPGNTTFKFQGKGIKLADLQRKTGQNFGDQETLQHLTLVFNNKFSSCWMDALLQQIQNLDVFYNRIFEIVQRKTKYNGLSVWEIMQGNNKEQKSEISLIEQFCCLYILFNSTRYYNNKEIFEDMCQIINQIIPYEKYREWAGNNIPKGYKAVFDVYRNFLNQFSLIDQQQKWVKTNINSEMWEIKKCKTCSIVISKTLADNKNSTIQSTSYEILQTPNFTQQKEEYYSYDYIKKQDVCLNCQQQIKSFNKELIDRVKQQIEQIIDKEEMTTQLKTAISTRKIKESVNKKDYLIMFNVIKQIIEDKRGQIINILMKLVEDKGLSDKLQQFVQVSHQTLIGVIQFELSRIERLLKQFMKDIDSEEIVKNKDNQLSENNRTIAKTLFNDIQIRFGLIQECMQNVLDFKNGINTGSVIKANKLLIVNCEQIIEPIINFPEQRQIYEQNKKFLIQSPIQLKDSQKQGIAQLRGIILYSQHSSGHFTNLVKFGNRFHHFDSLNPQNYRVIDSQKDGANEFIELPDTFKIGGFEIFPAQFIYEIDSNL